jgi:hypothetical protein
VCGLPPQGAAVWSMQEGGPCSTVSGISSDTLCHLARCPLVAQHRHSGMCNPKDEAAPWCGRPYGGSRSWRPYVFVASQIVGRVSHRSLSLAVMAVCLVMVDLSCNVG